MEEPNDPELHDFLSRRLIDRAQKEDQAMKQDGEETHVLEREGDALANDIVAAQISDDNNGTRIATVDDPELQSKRSVRLEKNLISIGFFTPSSRRIKDQKVKRITFTRTVEGKRVEAAAEFHPSAMFGLPVSADLDKYIALMDMISDIIRRNGKVSNPIRFTSAELLRHLNKRVRTGKNYKAVSEWLDVMTATMIKSDGVVYQAGKNGTGKFAVDRFHVFERAATIGQQLPDGTIADANYVWFSDWQLENINQNFLLPIDFATYRQLKNHIAKILATLLQVWLFASQKTGSYEKRYDVLCQMLSLQVYKAPSSITRQLKPSLDELIMYGYLKEWRIEKTTDRKSFKIVFVHGPKFFQDQRKRIKKESESPVVVAQSQSPEVMLPEPVLADAEVNQQPEIDDMPASQTPAGFEYGAEPNIDGTILAAVTKRGVTEKTARELLANLKPGQDVLDQLEWGEHQIKTKPGEIRNPAGFLIHLIQENVTVPSDFETSRKRAARVAEAELRKEEERLAGEYEAYKKDEIDRYIAQHGTEFAALNDAHISKSTERYGKDFPKNMIETLARTEARLEIGKKVAVLSFEEFVRALRAEKTLAVVPPNAESNEETQPERAALQVDFDLPAELIRTEAYEAYVEQTIDAYVADATRQPEMQTLLSEKRANVKRQYPNMTARQQEDLAERLMRHDLKKRESIMTFENFVASLSVSDGNERSAHPSTSPEHHDNSVVTTPDTNPPQTGSESPL